MARGGKNKLPGTPGGFGSQAVQVARSDQYGQAAASQRAQQAVPLPNMAQAPAGAAAPPPVMPGQLGAFDAPSARPWEPVSDGAPFGPGRQPGDLALPAPQGTDQFADLSPQLIMQYLPSLEALASQPGSSPTLQSLVRRMRMRVPADFDPTGMVG